MKKSFSKQKGIVLFILGTEFDFEQFLTNFAFQNEQ